MSLFGSVTLFCPSSCPDPAAAALRVMQRSGAQCCYFVEYPAPYHTHPKAPDCCDSYAPLQTGKAIDRVLASWTPASHIEICTVHCRWDELLSQAVLDGMPARIHGNFAPGNLYVHLGQHDIWGKVTGEKLVLFGDSDLAFSFFGYSTPGDAKEFMKRLLELPAFCQIRGEIEAEVGPVKVVATWSY